MTYQDCLNELDKHNLKEGFEMTFVPKCTFYFMEGLRNLETIHSTASLLRVMIVKLPFQSMSYKIWVDVLDYLMHPDFNKPDLYQQGWQSVSYQMAQRVDRTMFEQGIFKEC